jgi:hypothetical protein
VRLEHGTATVNLPFVSYLPSPGQAAYFGGLAALLEVLEWPVALAIGAGTALMGRSGDANRRR